MQNGKKLFMLDSTLLEKSQTTQDPTNNNSSLPKECIHLDPRPIQEPTVTNLMHLDHEMSDILQSQQSDRDKVQMYNQMLQRYLIHQNKRLPKPSLEVIKEEEEEEELAKRHIKEEDDPYVQDIVGSVPKTLVKKAEILTEKLMQNPHIQWNENGEVILHHRLLPKSNIKELVDTALRNRHRTPTLNGWQEFASALSDMNIPKEIIGNKHVWSVMSMETNTPKKKKMKRETEKHVHKWTPFR